MREIVNTGGEKQILYESDIKYDPDHPAAKGIRKYYDEQTIKRQRQKELNKKIMIILPVLLIIFLTVYLTMKFL